MKHKRHGRKKPYTEEGLKRLPCIRCGRPASFQWSVCADSNLWRPLCDTCDFVFNAFVLTFTKDPDALKKLVKYAKDYLEVEELL
jgi:hypothetical protein